PHALPALVPYTTLFRSTGRHLALAGISIMLWLGGAGFALAAAAEAAPVHAASTSGSSEERAASMVTVVTQDEKLTLLEGYFGTRSEEHTSELQSRENLV